MKPIISVEGLGKSYTIRHEGETRYKSLREELFKLPTRLLSRGGQSQEEFWALRDVNFDIMPGDRVGIIGRNGAGKSTLLKLLSRITEPTTGRITLRGRVASLLEVGTGFHPELTGRENIFLNGAILGMSRAEVRRKFDEIVDFAGVEKFLDTPVKRYSSGMYVRLAFAVAAHLEPEILIVDEVLAVGDAEFQRKCLGKMESAGKEGRTVLFVSHNVSAIRGICNNGIYLKNGTGVFSGKIEDAISEYSKETLTIANTFEADASRKHIKKIWFENRSHEKCSQFIMGDSFYICINLHGRLEDCSFGFNLMDSNRIRIASFGTLYQIKDYSISVTGNQTLNLFVKNCNLLPGKYIVSFSVSDKNECSVESVVEAAYFFIEKNDLFETGKSYEEAHGACFLDIQLKEE